MSITSISTVSDSNQIKQSQISKNVDMDKSDFLKLITAQLKYQDPLAPVNNFDFMGQAAQFNLLEQVINLNEKFDFLSKLYDMTYANSLLGKNVGWEDESGNLQTSVIEKIEIKDGDVWLYSEGKYIAPNWVKSIQASEEK